MPRLGLFFEPDLMLNIFTQAVDYKGFMKFSPEPPARKSLVFNELQLFSYNRTFFLR